MTSLYCPYLSNHCDITADYNRFSEADAIVYHMVDYFDKNQADKRRNPKQRIVFALWESPPYSWGAPLYDGFFNWTMTYRFKSHIITSYYSDNACVYTSSPYYQLILRKNSTKKLNYKTKN